MIEAMVEKDWRQGRFYMEFAEESRQREINPEKRYAEEREQGRRIRKRQVRGRHATRCIVLFLVVITLLIPGRIFFTEVRGFLGTGDLGILSEEEETSDVLVPGEIPLYLQKDRRWRKVRYGSEGMGVTGCGPTCLSMVLCGLRRDEKWMPVKVARWAEREGYYVSGSGSSWSLMTEGAERLGMRAEQLPLEEGVIRERLEAGHPIICIMGPGDFTDAGHFIVLSGMDDEGNIVVKDPNSRANSEKYWDLKRLMSQMKNLWAYDM